jgi:hypothetical protein
MFCPKCGHRNEGDYKFCRGCGENLKAIAKAIERRWLKLLYRALDGYIRRQNRKLPDSARAFRIIGLLWLMSIVMSLMSGLFGGSKDWWVWVSLALLVLLASFWDYVSFQRLSASGSRDNRSSLQPASLPDSNAEWPSAPTTNELELAPLFSVAESTTRRLEPLTAAKKRSGELL